MTPRAYGADQVRTRASGEIELSCPFAKAWTARSGKTLRSAEYPGTAVEWEGRIYEVLGADSTPQGGMLYRLGPWPENHAIRRLEHYDEISEQLRASDRRDRASDDGKRRLALLLSPLAGLLPADIQKKMERDFGAPALKMTIVSAIPLFGIGFLGLFAFLVRKAGTGLGAPAWLAPPLPVAAYLFGESVLRLASAIAGQEPMGSLPVVFAVTLWRSLGKPRAPRPAAVLAAEPLDERGLQDRFHVLEPALSFLSVGEQELLAGRFGFDAVRWGRITAAVLLAASVLNAIVSLSAYGAGDGVVWSVVWLLPVGYLAVEQVRRLQALARGEPAGSILGRLVRPFARPLLAAPPPVETDHPSVS